ncbi:MAG TPA: shikimate kinase [Kiritimatiellia bacterium]|nr:shikimate kinase [Kiritimatiellia bacterium]HMO97489.1 shikimate kinase [Kiritimatiellia bacterium]HMP96298.1 shikimate kinase [Kiritimatiellia bacterium]
MSVLPNIVLVGFMGTGKSSAGRVLAERLGMTFIDMDEEIVRREGCSIPDIFRDRGEAAFRALERALVVELAGQTGLVISTGGGIVLNPDNLRDFAVGGRVFCLKAKPETILARVAQDTNRPLLQGEDRLAKISDLLARRQLLYDAIPEQVDTEGHRPADTAEAILARLR